MSILDASQSRYLEIQKHLNIIRSEDLDCLIFVPAELLEVVLARQISLLQLVFDSCNNLGREWLWPLK